MTYLFASRSEGPVRNPGSYRPLGLSDHHGRVRNGPNRTETDLSGPQGIRMSQSIGGPVRYDLLTDAARIAHRPTDAAGMRKAALDLAASGLREADIAQALNISVEVARALLSEAR